MTITDIARLSGYGLGTVSRVLNNHPDVSERAKARVLAVVEQYGFEPNANARHLKMQAPSAIAVLVKGMQNLLFADILEQIQSLLQGSGEEVYVAYLDEDEDEVQHALRLTQLRHPKGFLFLGGDLACFAAEFSGVSVPAVLLTNGARELGFQNLSSFTTHDESAAEQAIDYLYQRGHRRIHVLGGNRSGTQISARRLLGVQQAMERHGLPCELERIHEPCRYSMEDGYQGARRLLERDPGVTALFALGDVIALGAVRAIRDLGLRIPEDISLIGYDGTAFSRYCVPRLTTIRQDAAQLARRGVQSLLDSIQRAAPPVHDFIPHALLEQESVCPPAR